MPRSIFLSHSGAFPFSVANWTSNPAFLNATYGTAVSIDGKYLELCELEGRCEVITCWIVSIIRHGEEYFCCCHTCFSAELIPVLDKNQDVERWVSSCVLDVLLDIYEW